MSRKSDGIQIALPRHRANRHCSDINAKPWAPFQRELFVVVSFGDNLPGVGRQVTEVEKWRLCQRVPYNSDTQAR